MAKEKKFVAVNVLTGAIVKDFKNEKKLAKYLFKGKKSALGDLMSGKIRPYDLFVRGAVRNSDGTFSMVEWVS